MRCYFLGAVLVMLAGVGPASLARSQPGGGSASKPNFVVIISDDQGYHDFGFMGHEVIQTPHLDRLAAESLVFTRGYVTTALCAPSLATMMTGLYPHQHGWTGNDPAKELGGWGKRQAWIDRYAAHPQLAALLAEAGYLSLHTGKYWQGDPEKVSGFTHSMGATQRHGSPQSLGIGRDGMQPIYDFIEEARDQDKPFLVWYAPFLPHTPHTPPQRLLEKYKDQTPNLGDAKYYAMVDWLDETCGELMQHLDDNGLRDNTVVMFIIDNGWPQGAPGYRGHKLTAWEQGVRTPIMIRWPGKVTPQLDEIRLASNLDIPVTVLAAAGRPVPDSMEGINLLDAEAVEKRECIFIEDFAHDMVAPDKPEASLEARGVICGEWKLVELYEEETHHLYKRHKNQRGQVPGTYLFNLKQDPQEKINLADQQPQKVAELQRQLKQLWNPKVKTTPAAAPEKQTAPPGEPVTRSWVFKKAGGVDLEMKIWYPPHWKKGEEKLPAVVMFFGGGWHGGHIGQFNDIAPYLNRRGMIVVTPQYRTGKQGAPPNLCLEDAKSAMRHVYAHAEELGIDRKMIAAGGRSAGGHLAAATAFSTGFNAADDDLAVNCKPAALVLFNPVIDNGPGGFRHDAVKEYWEDFSPLHNISPGPPPTLFLTGDQDQYTPIETAHRYKAEMEKQGGRCDLVIFEGGKHGSPFHKDFWPQTRQEMDEFLVSLGYLEPRQ